MLNIPKLFVSPHAVAQFQKRIAPLDDCAALRVIADGIRQTTDVSLLPDGQTWRIRTKRPFPYGFRAFCVMDQQRGHPVVVAILRGDGSVTRKRRRREQFQSEIL